MKEETCGILHRRDGGKDGMFLTFLLTGFCSLIIIAGIMTQSLTEGAVILMTEYGYHWRESFVRNTLASVQNPWIITCYEIRKGEETRNGVRITGVDTLIISVQGPRKEVESACETIERNLR